MNVFYIINYEGGGFAIMSADKRTPSVLAYSETNNFRTDTVPSGVDEWLYNTKIGIEEVRTKNIAYEGQDKIKLFNQGNDDISISQLPPLDPEPDPCGDTFEQVGPLLQTTWGQNGGYNNLMPTMSCTPWYNYGRAYTGCVSTAMAQIIRYHQFPANTYNYSIMPNFVNSNNMTSAGTNEIAKIMKDAAASVDSQYECDGTGANTQEDVPYALKWTFGFSHSSTRYLDYSGTANYSIVESEFRANRPVIFRGGRKGTWFVFPIYKEGHAWVSDGFQRSFYCETGGSYLFFHMNWGWDNSFNGWYGFMDFTPGDDTFNYKTGVIVGIKP